MEPAFLLYNIGFPRAFYLQKEELMCLAAF
jgi:hypothetical protein